jgi:hypothetical protein
MCFLLGGRELIIIWNAERLKNGENNFFKKQKRLELNEETTKTICNSETLELENLGTFFVKKDVMGT